MSPEAEERLKALPWILGMLVITSCVHEAGHAWAAYRLGDRREEIRRRTTPFTWRHISLPFTILLPAVVLVFTGFMFGGAKPVMVDLRKVGWKRMALVAISGPAGNFLVGGVGLAIVAGLLHAGVIYRPELDPTTGHLFMAVGLSFFLGFLNLLPIPPLDGSRVVAAFLPNGLRRIYLALSIPALILLFVGFVWVSRYDPEKISFIYDFFSKTVPKWIYGLRSFVQ